MVSMSDQNLQKKSFEKKVVNIHFTYPQADILSYKNN